jgi:hypothetical protein
LLHMGRTYRADEVVRLTVRRTATARGHQKSPASKPRLHCVCPIGMRQLGRQDGAIDVVPQTGEFPDNSVFRVAELLMCITELALACADNRVKQFRTVSAPERLRRVRCRSTRADGWRRPARHHRI